MKIGRLGLKGKKAGRKVKHEEREGGFREIKKSEEKRQSMVEVEGGKMK